MTEGLEAGSDQSKFIYAGAQAHQRQQSNGGVYKSPKWTIKIVPVCTLDVSGLISVAVHAFAVSEQRVNDMHSDPQIQNYIVELEVIKTSSSTAGQIFIPFCHNARVCQTDRRKDR